MKTPAPADLHRWSEELARNPGSLAFLPLARAYRRLGRRDLAVKLCVRGLENHPTHVEAHALLALLHFEAGDRAKAADEWATVLRLKPGNFEALRGMGFRYLEQGDIGKARQHLERAALIRPDDATVQEALRLIRQREAADTPRGVRAPGPASRAVRRPPTGVRPPEPARRARSAPAGRPAPAPAGPPTPPAAVPRPPVPRPAHPARPDPTRAAPPPATQVVRPTPEASRFEVGWEPEPPPTPRRNEPASPGRVASFEAPPDPGRIFESLTSAGPIQGVLLLDRRGLVLAGTLASAAGGAAETLGANLGGAIDEAMRAVTYLDLGVWRGIMLECREAVLHVRPVSREALVVVVARRDAPAGWIARAARHAASLAERFVEVYS